MGSVDRLARWLSRDEVLSPLLLVCTVASVAAPLWSARYLPFVDYPQHLAQIAAIAHIGDPRFAPYYELSLAKSQYFSFYAPCVLLAKLVGTELATRIVTTATLAGLPLAVAALLAAHGRSVMPASLSAFVALNVQTFWGFLNFALGVTVAILALAAHARLVARPDIRRAALFGAAAFVCFYAHPYAYAWLAAACLVQTLFLLPSAGREAAVGATWRALLASVPSVVALAFWLFSSRVLEHGDVGPRVTTGANLQDASVKFTPPLEVVAHWRDPSFAFYSDGAGLVLGKLFLGAVGVFALLRMALFVVRRVRTREGTVATGRPSSFAPEAVLALSFATYIFAPESYKLVSDINPRFLVIAFALLPVLAPVAMPTPARVVVAAAIAGLLGYHGAVHVARFRAFDTEMGDLDAALAKAAPGKRLLGLIFDVWSAVVSLRPFVHAHQYYQARVGGMAAWGFVELAHSPLAFREGAAPPPFPWGFEWNPDAYDWNKWGSSFDYILVRTQPGGAEPWPLRSSLAGRTKAAYVGTRWKLYEALPPEAVTQGPVAPGPDDLVVRDDVVGTGPAAQAGDIVAIEYTGTLIDGTVALRGKGREPLKLVFRLGTGQTLLGIQKGLLGMRAGGTRELVIPESMAYGTDGLEPDVPPRAGLIVDVKLLQLAHL